MTAELPRGTMPESKQLEKSEIPPQIFSTTKYNRPLVHWHTRPYRQFAVQKHLAMNPERDFLKTSIPQSSINPFNSTSWTKGERMQLNPNDQVDYSRQNPAAMKLLKYENSGVPKGISLVTERRLLARTEAINQRNQTGISAAQSLPRINESIALQLRANTKNSNVPWSRATASEPTLMSQNRGAVNAKWRLAAKAPVYFSSSSQAVGVNANLLKRTPSRSSTASDFAWYRNSMVSDIWK